jgi:uncharacterized protein YecT (DUF1311 family)
MKRLFTYFAALKGHDFSRAANAKIRPGALAPEGCFSGISLAPRFKTRVSMKTIIRYFSFLLFAVVVMFSSIPCNSQESAQYRACMDKANDQTSMNSCADAEYKRADSEMNGVYQLLLSKAEKVSGATAKIKTAEKAWILYRDAYMEALYPAKDKQFIYGSIYPMEFAEFQTALTREHTKALRDLIKQYDDEASVQ